MSLESPGIPRSQKPGMVTAIAVMTLISGIINILAGLTIGAVLAVTVVLLCLAPLGILPIVLGVFEILYALKLLPDPPQSVQPNQTIAILEIICIIFGNLLTAIAGVLALIFYNDATVKAYFARINNEPVPVHSSPAPQPASPLPPLTPKPEGPKRIAETVLPAGPEPVQAEDSKAEDQTVKTIEPDIPAAEGIKTPKPAKNPARPKSAPAKSTNAAAGARATKKSQPLKRPGPKQRKRAVRYFPPVNPK